MLQGRGDGFLHLFRGQAFQLLLCGHGEAGVVPVQDAGALVGESPLRGGAEAVVYLGKAAAEHHLAGFSESGIQNPRHQQLALQLKILRGAAAAEDVAIHF